MKYFARIGSLVIVLGAAGLFAGCSNWSNVVQRPRASSDFEVVETSSKRLLTPKEMAHLRLAVAQYLDKEGALDSGDYYVKIFLAPDKDGVPADWVVVRFTRDSELRMTLLGSSPAYGNSYQSYASYNYYPYGYDNFGRISFQYYNDPFYGSCYFYPRYDNRDRNRDHDGDRDNNRKHDGDRDHDRNRNHDGDQTRYHGRPADHPVAPGTPPPATPARWDRNSPERNSQPRENNFPRHGGLPVGQQERSAERSRNSGTAYAPAHTEAPRSETSSRSSSYSAPAARSEPAQAARSESSQSSSSNQSQKEANQAAAQRERLE